MQIIVVKKEESGQTLEKFLKKRFKNMPLSFLYKLFRKKDVKVNSHWQDKKYIICEGDVINVYIKDEQLESFDKECLIQPNDEIKPFIVYEDENVLIINKPRGLLVQPDSKTSKSLDRMVLSYLLYKGEYDPTSLNSVGPAHRLDRNTSGLVLFGKNINTLQYLSNALKDHQLITKHYYTLVLGEIKEDGIVDAPLKKDESNNKVYLSSVKDGGKEAKTIYHVLDTFNGYTLLDITLLTGRTHQIRVHMASINHPVIGDSKYGDFKVNKEFENKYHFYHQFLQAYELDFHKVDGPLIKLKNQNIVIELNKEYLDILNNLRSV